MEKFVENSYRQIGLRVEKPLRRSRIRRCKYTTPKTRLSRPSMKISIKSGKKFAYMAKNSYFYPYLCGRYAEQRETDTKNFIKKPKKTTIQ